MTLSMNQCAVPSSKLLFARSRVSDASNYAYINKTAISGHSFSSVIMMVVTMMMFTIISSSIIISKRTAEEVFGVPL